MPNTLRKNLLVLVRRYGHLGMKYFGGRLWTVVDLLQMVGTGVVHADIGKNLSKGHRLPKLVGHLAEFLRLRTMEWEMMCKSTSLFRRFVEKYFNDYVSYDELLSLQIPEVLELLSYKYPIPVGDRSSFILECDESGVRLSINVAAGVAHDTSDPEKMRVVELKGTCAFRGTVRGIARIVLHPNQSHKVKSGDILVATMSTPDFLPAMRKAAAFVTDIGGITCHAAIVAREMKKPCIIGTNNATRALKDGDMVEVDADNGVVRIVDRK